MEQTTDVTKASFDRINAAIAALVAIISFIIYRATVAPTLSYWDCGEFIACAHILGNPHPPGSPLFVLVGRFFDLLPIGSDVAFRINMLSVVSSSFAALFSYLIIVRLVSSWYRTSENNRLGRIIAYAAGFSGALFTAFSQTNWNNSVETEVYGLSMVITMAIFWLGLKWFDCRYSPTGQRIVLLVSFLAFISIGIHMVAFLVVPIVAIFFSLKENTRKWQWGMVAGFFIIELLLIIIMSGSFARYKLYLVLTIIMFGIVVYLLKDNIHWPVLLAFAAIMPVMVGFYPFLLTTVGFFIVSMLIWFVRRESLWRLSWMILLAGIIGYSVHIYIPLRSAQHPAIDENAPSRSFSTFVNFLDRKQYGSMSMTERMFVRRGTWVNQFGDHARMGFWRFFKGQYSDPRIFPIFLFIGIFGLIILIIKNPSWGYIFLTLVLISSVGLVLYMNFADGTQFNKATGDAYQEVRDRDYFFTSAYMLFGMAIGIGLGGIIEMIRKYVNQTSKSTTKTAVYAASILVLLTSYIPCQANYFANDRSQNYMAYDYAYNLLNTCKENAVLFTSGDNDTFPLWCVQEIYNLRKDVRVINFSLLNTDWYVWQMKNFMNVPISLSDDQILWVPYVLQDGTEITKPERPFFDRTRNRQAWLIPMPFEGKLMKVASMMLDEIILTNKWQYPIYFSSISGEVRESLLKLPDRCYKEGLLYHLTPDIAGLKYKEDITDSLFFQVYRYTNLSDTMVAQNENASGIALSMPEKLIDYYQQTLDKGDTEKADFILNKACELIPAYWRLRLYQRDAALAQGDSTLAQEIKDEIMAYLHGFRNKNPENIFFYQYLGLAYYSLGEKDKSIEYLNEAWDLNHDKEQSFRALLVHYAEQRNATKMVEIARQYKEYSEDDPVANEILRSAQYILEDQRMKQLQQQGIPELPDEPQEFSRPIPRPDTN